MPLPHKTVSRLKYSAVAAAAIATAALLLGGASTTSADQPCDGCGRSPVEIRVHDDQVLRTEKLGAFLSFNMNHYAFERDLLQRDGTVAPKPMESLREFDDSFYRYPGGLVSNRFDWEASMGPVADRAPQSSVDHSPASAVKFGLDEYTRFVQAINGKPWYVLNLVGWDDSGDYSELPSDEIAASNAKLAELIRERFPDQPARYYQLGNELDRAKFQWPTEKYVARSQDSIQAIRKVDPDARFVAFLRDFDWRYKGKRDPRAGTVSSYPDLIRDVLEGLPEVNDISLHFYYDDPDHGRKFKKIDWRLLQLQKAIDVASSARNGDTPNVWITEHARGVNLGKGKGMQRANLTSNLSATISTADFLTGIAQMPEIKGAFWHGLNAGPWQLFDASVQYSDLRPRPVYWGLRVLGSVLLGETLKTETGAQPGASYGKGYAVRATAFRDPNSGTFGLWVINREDQRVPITINYKPLAGKPVDVRQYEVHGPAGADAESAETELTINLEPRPAELQFGSDGRIELILEPLSVSAIEIKPSGQKE